jgi:hypothetical protein
VSAAGVVVFLGPTLPSAEAAQRLAADYRPPACHGDVFLAAREGPSAIALVDGSFDAVLSVWHKEILWALDRGVAVYGASSMGALRAAELAPFGMTGVGEIYRALATGTLEDDDEVAVAHAGPDDGWRPLSDAMVDVRATLRRAVDLGVVDEAVAGRVAARVKATPYPRRLLATALDGTSEAEREFGAWLPGGWVHQKRLDALALLDLVAREQSHGARPGRSARQRWTFPRTVHWEDAQRALEREASQLAGEVPEPALLDELRLDPERFEVLADRAEAAVATARYAAVAGAPAPWADEVARSDVLLARDLAGSVEVDGWLAGRDLDRSDLVALAERARRSRSIRSTARDDFHAELLRAARAAPGYAELRRRAAAKVALLADVPPAVPEDDTLLRWYFVDRLGRDVPGALNAWARCAGWVDPGELVRALRRDWTYRRAAGE